MRYLILFSLFISLSALACPDISGEYACLRNNQTTFRSIEVIPGGFRMINGIHTNDYITDGTTIQTLPDTDSMKDGKYKSHCQGNKLIVDFTATIMYEGSAIARQVSKTTYQLKNDQLEIIQKVRMKGIPLPTIRELCSLQ